MPIIAASFAFACASTPVGDISVSPSDSMLGSAQSNSEPPPDVWVPKPPVIPPRVAQLAGLMPLRAIGVEAFRREYPMYDGTGVIIGLLDSGVDPDVPGLLRTTNDEPKIIDLRDFSAEGRISLHPLDQTTSDTVVIGELLMTGFSQVRRRVEGPYYSGIFRERELGGLVAADVNGNGLLADEFPVIVARSGNLWVAITDTDGDRSFEGEKLVHDYALERETFTYRTTPEVTADGPLTIAVNLDTDATVPVLDFFFDDSGHGTHVAGIAAGHDMFGIDGFDGVAPGAQIIGLKIADNSRGGISVGGSIVRAMDYVARVAEEMNLPLVINMSHGVGNEAEGGATIDSIVSAFAIEHPTVPFVVSVGNEGPGLSSTGFPGSAEYALSVCALYPMAFAPARRPGARKTGVIVAPWSARGGEAAKPDICAPGKAFSTVPRWRSGKEVLEGTSQAAPQISGAIALLRSALRERTDAVRAVEITRALKNTATLPVGQTRLDMGFGIPDVLEAYEWLVAGHQAGVYSVRALRNGGNTSTGTAAFRRSGLRSASDTIQSFVVQSVGGQPAARLLLESDAEWVRAPALIEPGGLPVTIDLVYDASKLRSPGLHVGTVTARSATDTTAGPLFSLVNTVIVPNNLTEPYGDKHRLDSRAVHRHFVDVGPGSGGLEVSLGVPDPASKVTLHLFEPSGRPIRSQSELTVGGFKTPYGSISVTADELVPGVYEAVVAVPPAEEAEYELQVAVPQVAVTEIRDGPDAIIRNNGVGQRRVIVSAEFLGAGVRHSVEGRGSSSETVEVVPPFWAQRMLLEVSVPTVQWNRITGFGVTVFDSTGLKISDGPMNYAEARQLVELEWPNDFGELTLELLPAFALPNAQDTWTANVEISFLLPDPIPLSDGEGNERIGMILPGNGSRRVSFVVEPEWYADGHDLIPIVQVVASPPSGPPSTRLAFISQR